MQQKNTHKKCYCFLSMPGDLNEGLKISLIIPEMSKIGLILSTHTQVQPKHYLTGTLVDLPPVDLHWFFEIP